MAIEMNPCQNFDFDRFVELVGLDLCLYMEPIIQDKTAVVSDEVIDRLVSGLPTYDEYHLAYALQLGVDHSPQLFLRYVPNYLAHEGDSVFCTALNILDKLPSSRITEDLVSSVRLVARSGSLRPMVQDAVVALADRMTERGWG
jgi:hypothetical protein